MAKVTIETTGVLVDGVGTEVAAQAQAIGDPVMLFKRWVTHVTFNLTIPRRQGMLLLKIYHMNVKSSKDMWLFINGINMTDLGGLMNKGLVQLDGGAYRISKPGELVAQLLELAQFSMM